VQSVHKNQQHETGVGGVFSLLPPSCHLGELHKITDYDEGDATGGRSSIFLLFKGTVSPDIALHFSFWKIKLVLSAGLLMVLTFFYFVVPEIFKN
jgi:hypothetical protein